MVSEGYQAVGYEYVNIDDCWPEMERDKDGKLVADKERFPSGIKALSRYVSKKGFDCGQNVIVSCGFVAMEVQVEYLTSFCNSSY